MMIGSAFPSAVVPARQAITVQPARSFRSICSHVELIADGAQGAAPHPSEPFRSRTAEDSFGSWAALRGCAATVCRTFSTGHHGTGYLTKIETLKTKGLARAEASAK